MLRPIPKQSNWNSNFLVKPQILLGAALSFCYSVFPGYFVQLIYSCTHLFSDTGHLLSTAKPSSRARTVDAWEVRGHTNSELYALHSTDVAWEVRPVRRLLVICCWFLVPVGRDVWVVLTNGNTVADRCSTLLRPRRSLERFHPLTEHAPYVTLTDRRLALTWSSPSPSPSPRCSWP